MIAISQTLIRRISVALSYLSAICPALAENRMKGTMNRPAAMFTSTPVCMPANAEPSGAKRAVW